MIARAIDPRAWLVWTSAAMLVPLTGRNPYALAAVLLAVLAVREALPPESRLAWRWIVRLGIFFGAVAVVFNLLTVRSGNLVIADVPASIPIFGGPITWNSVVFGVLGGVAVFTLVAIGITLSAVLDWSAMLRLMPASLSGAGVAGSVAFSFFPQMVATYREVVESQAMRGRTLVGPRDYLALAPAILSGGIERAVTMSELLESRGFGAPARTDRSRVEQLALPLGATAVCVAVYLFAVDRLALAVLGAGTGGVLLASAVVLGRSERIPRTRYRDLVWRRTDSLVVAGSLLTIAGILAAPADAIRYEPYPTLTWPQPDLRSTLCALGLLMPAFVLIWGDWRR